MRYMRIAWAAPGLVACSAVLSPGLDVSSDGGQGGAASGNGGGEQGGSGGISEPGDASVDDASKDAAAGAAATDVGVDGGAGGRDAGEACPQPAGDDVSASTYAPPETAGGCNFSVAAELSATLASEADFLEFFDCPEQAASGIDFGAQRLRVSVVPEAGFVQPTREYAVLSSGVVTLVLELPVYCGGAFPPTAVVLTLLPAGTEEVRDDVCRLGDCGAGGFPP
jgi:hypothetical protein